MIRFEMGEEVIIKNRSTVFGQTRTIIGIRLVPELLDCPLYTVTSILATPLYALDNKQFCKYEHVFHSRWCPIFRIYKLEEA